MAISTPRDNNRKPTLLGTLNTDGATVISVKADPVSHNLLISNGTSGSSLTTTNVQRDSNRVPAVWALSSADGVTPVSVYTNSAGLLLTKST